MASRASAKGGEDEAAIAGGEQCGSGGEGAAGGGDEVFGEVVDAGALDHAEQEGVELDAAPVEFGVAVEGVGGP
ncbi:hypothetical protein ACQEU8_30340 [Streptomyces sp. CA-250714]|uniref:hypothetical protein n=1 Tax=Streptomyces sp. CA-250714 TaxID=3240060 RepID=UPI003D8A0F93